jgi:hypothetical protein
MGFLELKVTVEAKLRADCGRFSFTDFQFLESQKATRAEKCTPSC